MVSSTDGPYKVNMKSFRGYLCKQNFRIGHLKQCRRPDFKMFSYVAIKEPSRDGTFCYCVCPINKRNGLLIAYCKIPYISPGLIDTRKHFILEGYILRAHIWGGLILGGHFVLVSKYQDLKIHCYISLS